jgi:membrane fusion protein, multidrug efflux system
MRKLAMLLSGLVVLVAGLVLGWTGRSLLYPGAQDVESSDEEAQVKPADMDAAVVTAPIERGDLPVMEPVAGVVKTDTGASVTISSVAGGTIRHVLANPGAMVEAGQPILEFDPVPLQAAVIQAEAQATAADNALAEFQSAGRATRQRELAAAVDAAKSTAVLAGSKLASVKQAFAKGLVSVRAVEEAAQAADQADKAAALADAVRKSYETVGAEFQRVNLTAARDSARSSLSEARRGLEQAKVLAPVSGQLAALAVQQGDRAEPRAPLGTVIQPAGRLIGFGVSASLVPRLRIGQTVTWTGLDEKEATGKIKSVQRQVDPATGMVEVLVAPDDATMDLPPGLIVRGKIEMKRLTGVLLVPDRALVRKEDHQVIVTVGADQLAKIVAVNVMGEDGGLIAVEGEIEQGNRVIVEGGYNLPDGAKVHEQKAESGPAQNMKPQANAGSPVGREGGQ